jgi:hypothetical protein
MITRIPLLQNIRVAAPCAESWDDMVSVDGDRVHHCLGCNMNVYNLSAMTQSEAEGLLRQHEGRLCVRYYQRRDGMVMTRNCPVGAQAARLLLIRRSLAATTLFLVGGAFLHARSDAPATNSISAEADEPMMGSPATPIDQPAATVVPVRPGTKAVPEAEDLPLMGEVAVHAPAMGRLHILHLENDDREPKTDIGKAPSGPH